MKKSNIKIIFAASFGLFLFQGNVYSQNLKSLINKVAENESVKKVVDAVKENETVKTTVEAVKVSVIEGVNAKIEELKNPKVAELEVKSPAQPLAPDVKNSISDVRSFTGLTKEEFDAKVKAIGFSAGVDDTSSGAIVYKSKTAGYVLTIKMGLRNEISYVREVAKTTITKKANLATVKTNFIKLGKQTEELKAQFTNASIKAKSAKGTNVEVLNIEDKNSKLIPALNKFSTKKEDGTVTEAYSETDYTYDLSVNQTTVKGVSTTVLNIKVTDLTASIQ